MHVIDTLAPVFLIVAVGALLRAIGFLSVDLTKGIIGLTYWIALPALLFYKIATSDYQIGSAVNILAVVAGGMLVCILLGLAVCIFLNVPKSSRGAFIQGSFRGNLVYVGLPIAIFHAMASVNANAAIVERNAILSLSMIIPIYNITAVLVMIGCGSESRGNFVLVSLRKLATNPLIIGCLAGVLYRLILGDMPLFMMRGLEGLGMMALPLALLGIGASLVQSQELRNFQYGLTAALIKVFVAPAAGVVIIKLFGLSVIESQTALIFLACPTAVSSFILADEMGSDRYLAGGIVVMSSLLSLLSLILVVSYIS